MFKHKNKIFGSFIAFSIIAILLLVGPADAILVSLSQPNDANKGSDVSFSITTEIKDSDLLPDSYTNLVITGPSGFSKTCKINSDLTDDCSDVDVTGSKTNLNLVSGAQYGYDQNLGYGYSLGTGWGYQSTSTGTITYNIIWHTSSTLTDGSYSAKADLVSTGSSSSHTFKSSSKSFIISTASSPSGGGGGGGSGSSMSSGGMIIVNPVVIEEQTPTNPETPSNEGTTGNEASNLEQQTEVPGITGAAVGTNLDIGAFFASIGNFFASIWNFFAGLFN